MIKDYLKAIIQCLTPKFLLTIYCGLLADCKHPRLKNYFIQRFIKIYQVNMSEALYPAHSYASFNDFFIRHLQPNARKLNNSPFICPVDGSVSQIGRIHKGQLIQAKGRTYSLSQLIQQNEQQISHLEGGLFATLYLSPKDYHRIHMPIDGKVRSMVYVPGKLFSVQPATTRVIPNLFAQNERVVVVFDTPLGEMIMILVGATIVGKIATQWHGEFKRRKTIQHFDFTNQHICLKKGEEMGYFKLGSTVILIMEANFPYNWDKKLKEGAIIRLYQGLVE